MPREHITPPTIDGQPFPTELTVLWSTGEAAFGQLGIEIRGRRVAAEGDQPDDVMVTADVLDMLYGCSDDHLAAIGKAARALQHPRYANATGTQADLELGTAVLDVIRASVNGDPDQGRFNSLWITSLDRAGWQHLIRTAKRARNAIFGADE